MHHGSLFKPWIFLPIIPCFVLIRTLSLWKNSSNKKKETWFSALGEQLAGMDFGGKKELISSRLYCFFSISFELFNLNFKNLISH